MDVSRVGHSIGHNTAHEPRWHSALPASNPEAPQSGDQLASAGKSDASVSQELAAVTQLLEMLLKALSGDGAGNGGGGGGTPQSDSDQDAEQPQPQSAPPQQQPQQQQPQQQSQPQQPPKQQLDSQPPQQQGGQQPQAAPQQQGGQQPQSAPQQQGAQQPQSAPQQQGGQQPQGAPQPGGSPTASSLGGSTPSGGAAAAPAGGIDTTSSTGQREDVLIGSYTDPQDLADPGQIAKNPRVGLWLTQLGFDQSDTAGQKQATADAWQGKGYSLERATYSGGYGTTQAGDLYDQFTGATGGKENLNTQTADVPSESGIISDSSVSQFEGDLQSQRANGQNLLPVYGPNAAAGQPGSYTQGFDSPDFNNFRTLAKSAGGFVLDAPPSLMNQPQYTQWYQDATKWAHSNGLKVEWYASPAVGDTDPAAYQANIQQAVANQKASGTSPDTYILGNYVQGNPAATVASEETAAQWILNNTTQTAD